MNENNTTEILDLNNIESLADALFLAGMIPNQSEMNQSPIDIDINDVLA